MPKLVKSCADIDEFENLRSLGPNAGVGSLNVVKVKHSQYYERDEKRHDKWVGMISSWSTFSNKNPSKIKSRVRKGVPDSDRRSAWNRLVQVHSYIARFPGLYEDLANRELEEHQVLLIDYYRTIDLDLYRTFPERTEFEKGTPKGEASIASLRRVLRAYAQFDQGAPFFVPLLSILIYNTCNCFRVRILSIAELPCGYFAALLARARGLLALSHHDAARVFCFEGHVSSGHVTDSTNALHI